MTKRLTTVQIQDNVFVAEEIATTQDDAFGEVLNKWELFSCIRGKKGDLLIGRLFQSLNREYSVSHFSIGESGCYDFIVNYDVDKKDIVFNYFVVDDKKEGEENNTKDEILDFGGYH